MAIWGGTHGIKQDFVISPSAMAREKGASYTTALPAAPYLLFKNLTDTPDSPTRSRTELFENDTPLGPAHSLHDDIRGAGSGQFSHWGSILYFSTSDNSDPSTNGRRYMVVITAISSMWLLAALLPCLLISLYLNRWILRRAAESITNNMKLLFLIVSILLTGMAIWGVAHGIKQDFLIPAFAMGRESGASYTTALPESPYWLFENLTDTPGSLTRSRTELFENDTPLGPAHRLHEAIRTVGKGQFSHWGSTLYFSTSDNSDPRNNGRRYKVVITAAISMWVFAVLVPSLLISWYLNRRIVSLTLARPEVQLLSLISSILLAGAGLVYGLWLRVLFFRSFPDPLPTPDTFSYMTGVYSLLKKGQFDLASMRTPGFPLLAWITLVVFKSFAALNVVHGALTLLSASAIAYVVRAFGGPWRWPAAVAVCFLAVHPHLLYWEHFVMTEGSFQAFFVLAVGATALAILRPTPDRAAIAGVLAAIAVLIRPNGLFLTPLVPLALAWAGRSLGRRKLLWMLAAGCAGPLLLLGGWSVRNAAVHGFFGLTNQGPLINVGVSGRPLYVPEQEVILHQPRAFVHRGLSNCWVLVTGEVRHGGYDFAATARCDENWDLAKLGPQDYWEQYREFPVNQYRASLDQTRFPLMERERIYTRDIIPFLVWEMPFIRMSLGATLFALLALPLLRGPRRLATALAVVSVVLLILTPGFLAEAADRYLSVIHGVAAFAGALAITGLLERWLLRVRKSKPLPASVSKYKVRMGKND